MKTKHDSISINELTKEFLYFAKVIGIYPKIVALFYSKCQSMIGSYVYEKNEIEFFKSNSFYRYADVETAYETLLNDNMIKRVYLFVQKSFFGDEFSSFKNLNDIVNLFFSHLKDKGYYRYIRVKHEYNIKIY